MKKILSLIMLLVVIFTLAPATTALACDCGCDCCNNTSKIVVDAPSKTEKQLAKKTKSFLKPQKSYAKKYGWTTETKVTKKTSSKLYTAVHFHNDTTRYYMDVTIRAIKKNGKITTEWWFKDKNTGKWTRTTPEGVNRVLKRSGKKVSAKAAA